MDWSKLFAETKTADGRQFVLGQLIAWVAAGSRLPRQFADLRSMLLTLRNCSIEDNAAPLLIEHGLILAAVHICSQLALSSTLTADQAPLVEGGLDDAQRNAVALAVCQLLGNFTAASTIAADFICADLRLLSSAFAAAVVCRHPAAVAVCWNIMYNCICANKSSAQLRLDVLCSNRPVLCQALLSLTDSAYVPRTPSAPAGSNDSDNDNDALFEWVVFCALRWAGSGKAVAVLDLVGSSTGIAGVRVTQEQVILIEVLALALSANSSNNKDDDDAAVVRSELVPVCLHLCDILCSLRPSSSEGTDPIGDAVQFAFTSSAVHLLSDLLIADPAFIACLQGLLPQRPLVRFCLTVIQHKDVGSLRAAKGKGAALGDEERAAVKACLQLLSILLHRCPLAQDQLYEHRDKSGVHSILCHCVTDFANPLAREWALLCVRNACEGHALLQEYIASLRAQDAVIVDDQLQAAGMQVTFNPETGRCQVQQQQQQQQTPPR